MAQISFAIPQTFSQEEYVAIQRVLAKVADLAIDSMRMGMWDEVFCSKCNTQRKTDLLDWCEGDCDEA